MKEIIQINSVVLNEKAMNLLESCQKDDNYLINFSVNNLKNTVCLISRNFDAFCEDDCKEASDLMQGLSILASEITKLKTS
jgi:hypothetical protein